MSFAVIETGGKQYKVSEGDVISVEKINGKKTGDSIEFSSVLLFDDGKDTKVGTPNVDGMSVSGEIVNEGRGKKIPVIRFRSKSRYFRNKGHRQPFMEVKIGKIGSGSKKSTAKATTTKKKETPKKETKKKAM